MNHASTVEPGSVIDKYEILEVLGQGAMARVYKVRHRGLNAHYALKVLQVARGSLPERLLREGEVQASLRHRNVVRVTDTLLVDGMPGLVMEYIEGSDLDAYLEASGRLSLDEIRAIGEGVIRGVRAAHRAGQLHRDLKPANVMLALEDDEWVPKVADFGLTKSLEVETKGSSGSTQTGQIMGSPAYMSPEQARDSKNVDERTDVFSIGCILYEMAAGERAFEGPDFVSTMARIAAGSFKPIDELRPELPANLVTAIHGCLVVDRELRIPDCDTLFRIWRDQDTFQVPPRDAAATFQSLLGTPPVGPAVSLLSFDPETAPTPQRRRWPIVVMLLFAAAMVFMGALLVGGVSGVLLTQNAPAPVTTPAPPPEPSHTEPSGAEPTSVEAEADPVPTDPESEPTAEEPQPTAQEPRPAAPEPQPAPPPARPRPRPAPAPRTPPPVAPAPSKPATLPTGTVVVKGGAIDVTLVRDGVDVPPGAVRPGLYQVRARFEGEPTATDQGLTVHVEAGRTTVIECDPLSWRCVSR